LISEPYLWVSLGPVRFIVQT